MNIIQGFMHIPSLGAVALMVIYSMQQIDHLDYLNVAMLMRILGMSLFNAELCSYSCLLGGIIEFGFN